jgi:hypothetical protein
MFDRLRQGPPPQGIVEPGVGRYVAGEGGAIRSLLSSVFPWLFRRSGDAAEQKPPSERV